MNEYAVVLTTGQVVTVKADYFYDLRDEHLVRFFIKKAAGEDVVATFSRECLAGYGLKDHFAIGPPD